MRRNVQSVVCLLALSALLAQPVFSAGTANFVQHYDAAQSFLEQGQYSSAIVEFRKALRINYLDNSARIGLINSYLARATYYANQEKNFEKSGNDFRSAIFYLKMYPSKDQTIANSASMIASATENLNQCLRVMSFDQTAGSRYRKAEELRAIGNFSAAAYEFSKAAAKADITANAYCQIADLMKLLGNEQRCADYYKMALDLTPTDGVLRMKYARTLDRLGDFDQAVTQYNYALEHSKGDMEVLYALERIYLKKLAQTPSDAELNANLGAIKQAQGDFEAALSYYSKAEQINPSNVNTRINIGTLFQQKKDYQKAIQICDEIIQMEPQSYEAYLYKGNAYYFIEKYTEAEDCFIKSFRYKPQEIPFNIEVLTKLGLIYIKTEQWDEAKVIFNQILHTNHNHSFAWLYLGISLNKLQSILAVINESKMAE